MLKKSRILFILFTVVISFIGTHSWAYSQISKDFIIHARGNKYTVKGINNSYVQVEELGKFFGFDAVSLPGSRSAKIGHLYYNKNNISCNGKFYVDVPTFLKFFDMPFTQVNPWTISLNCFVNPMFNTSVQRYHSNVKVSVNKRAPVTVEVLTIKNRIFIPVEPLASELGGSPVVNKNGRLTIQNRQVDRWTKFNDKIYAFVDDLIKVTGKQIKVDIK